MMTSEAWPLPIAAGFDHHLIKPLDPGELQELVRGAGSQLARSNDDGLAS